MGAGVDCRLANTCVEAATALSLQGGAKNTRVNPVRELEQVKAFISGQGLSALFDAPWMPLYLICVFLLHPVLGLLGLIGGLVLVAAALINDRLTRAGILSSNRLRTAEANTIESARRNVEVLSAMGLGAAIKSKWLRQHHKLEALNLKLLDQNAIFGSFTKTVRLVLQSAMLGAGAYLAISAEMSPGAMIAASIILARVLAPIEQMIGNWRAFGNALNSARILDDVLPKILPARQLSELPRPSDTLSITNLSAVPFNSEKPVLSNITFSVSSGDGVAVIGPSGAGKSSLARTLVGAWAPASGEVRLDGSQVDHYPKEIIDRAIGYLPQDVELFEGTIVQNIARFEDNPDMDAVLEAAHLAGCHELIQNLPEGYDTQIGVGGSVLSGGQRQRIGLARAVYGKPFLVILDEPNANLDPEGEAAVHTAISSLRQSGSIVITIAHRPSALAGVNKILAVKSGTQVAFGDREEVLMKLGLIRKSGSRGSLAVVNNQAGAQQ